MFGDRSSQGSSQDFWKEYTEGNCGGPGAGAPGKILTFDMAQPYFFCNFVMQKARGRSMDNPE